MLTYHAGSLHKVICALYRKQENVFPFSQDGQ